MERRIIHSIRRDYLVGQLLEKNVNPNPINQFSLWLNQAIEKGVLEPTAMTLATVDQSGLPSARMVLLKFVSDKGFIFFTNYESQKGNNIADNQNVALLFFWSVLERQIRIVGQAVKLEADESDKYFLSRPLESRIATYASPQSKVIPNREYIVDRFLNFKKRFHSGQVNRPENWGGY
ncbi:MAG: pyridoxamine 5'-phosphate oxidase, partial [Bacteroidota bacterium]|nr:pyridoxamine 5'-phosphate oxidase [Bacteroidota bacterium]